MAYTTINKSSDYFNTKLYTGNNSYGHSITGVGFQPDFVWIKSRNTAKDSNIYDAVRGTDKTLESNTTDAERTAVNLLGSFDSDGFTVDDDSQINGNYTYASWNWKAGTTSGITTDGNTTITPSSYSINQTAGFSILKFTGNGVTGAKLAHGLNGTPANIVIKKIDATGDWTVYHKDIATGKNMWWNYTQAETADNLIYSPDAKNITLLNHSSVNTNGTEYIAYCWKEVIGYSKFGSYTGNGNNDGTFVYTGFKPAFVMIKSSSDSSTWHLADNKRIGYNPLNYRAQPNNSNAEYTGVEIYSDFLSNGFKLRNQDTDTNGARTYIYMAFAEAPLVGSNNVPCTAR